jgi:transposase
MSRVPLDLRRRIVEAYERKEGTYFKLAQRFGVGEATVYRLLRLKRERGSVAPGAPGGIAEDELPKLVQLVGEFPDATLDQLREVWAYRNRCELSLSSIARGLLRAGITRKKTPGRRGRSARAPSPNMLVGSEKKPGNRKGKSF